MFDRARVGKVSDMVVKAAAARLKAQGLTVQRGNATFYDGHFTLKLTISDPKLAKKEQGGASLSLGLPKGIMGKRFNFPTQTGRRRMFEVVDIVPRRHKFPVLAKNVSTGTRYKFSVAQIKKHLER